MLSTSNNIFDLRKKFEYVKFNINKKYSKKNDSPNYYASLVIFLTYIYIYIF